MAPRKDPSKRRSRVRVAQAATRRLEHQQRRLASDYATTTSPRERVGVLTRALLAAAAPGTHQVDDVDAVLAPAVTALDRAVRELHQRQQSAADRVLNARWSRQEGSP